jgi:hypothetical protein
MSADLTPIDVAGILDQLYRASVDGLPRRFRMSSEELRDFAGRRRSLRPEFFDQVALELECRYSILMSYPRLGRHGVLGFVSSRFAESWPIAADDKLRELLRPNLGPDWGQSVRGRLGRLYETSQDDPTSPRPILLSEHQLCQLAEQLSFRQSWWSELMKRLTNALSSERLIFFYHGVRGDRVFAVTRQDHITNENYTTNKKWHEVSPADWAAAVKRYDLDEVD